MGEPFIGSEALASERLTRHRLRSRFTAVYPNVYVAGGTQLTATDRARAAWLWSQRRGVLAGQSAAAMLGAKWVDPNAPAELLHDNRCVPEGIRSWADRFDDDEVQRVRGVPVTTPPRTALDIASRYPRLKALTALDALARATRFDLADVSLLADRYRGRSGLRRAQRILPLVDGGAESPRETWLRLLLIDAGFPRPQTQIVVRGPYGELVGVIDMGNEQIKLGIDYEGEHHRVNRWVFNNDIRRSEALTELGWKHLRFTAEDTEGSIIARVRAAWTRRL